MIALPLSTLAADPGNPRTIDDASREALGTSLAEFGDLSGITWNARTRQLVAGHQRVERLTAAGARLEGDKDGTPRRVIDARTGEAFVVRVVDWPVERQRAANLTANNPHIAGTFTFEALGQLEALAPLPEFAPLRLDALATTLAPLAPVAIIEDEAPEPPAVATTRRGDLWLLGDHRLLCGDSTNADDVTRLMDRVKCDVIVTDPPYCSGGFQEAGRSAGSVGTSAEYVPVANDRLSTRGYMALLKTAFSLSGAPYLYAFTDWRMWVHLFDIAESSGFCVRSMIVWDKGTPGMGRGWRSQHEIVLWACKTTAPFDKHAPGCGNVIRHDRSGNKNHTTEKPVGVIATLLGNTPFATNVYDPFGGSGTTVIACEQLGRRCYAMEIAPAYVDVAVLRWQALTGRDAALDDGRTFACVRAARAAETA